MREPHEHLVGKGAGPWDVASILACKGAGFWVVVIQVFPTYTFSLRLEEEIHPLKFNSAWLWLPNPCIVQGSAVVANYV